jgi:hypothetical protein
VNERRGLNCPKEQLFKCLKKNAKGKLCPNQMFFIPIGKLPKQKYQKSSCIFYFSLQAKFYEKKKFQGSNFQVLLLHVVNLSFCGLENLIPSFCFVTTSTS